MKREAVNHPSHYGGVDDPYEHIKVAEALGWGYHLGNATKYIWRAGKKNRKATLEDLRKAAWYLNREIQRLQGLVALGRAVIAPSAVARAATSATRSPRSRSNGATKNAYSKPTRRR